MWRIDGHVIASFITIYGEKGKKGSFMFNGRKITNYCDVLAACRHIYITKSVLYKRSRKSSVPSQRWSLGRNAGAIAARDTLLEDLARKIWNYFNLEANTISDQKNFDSFHNELCKWFLDGLNKVRRMVGLPDATYGNAQKMINILFKYLICFDDYLDFADLFSYCHMPIDNNILRDFLRLGVPGVVTIPSKVEFVWGGVAQSWHEFDELHYLNLLAAYRTTIDPIKSPNLSYIGVEFSWFSKAALPVAGTPVPPIRSFYK